VLVRVFINPHPNKPNYNLICIRGVWTDPPGNLTTIQPILRLFEAVTVEIVVGQYYVKPQVATLPKVKYGLQKPEVVNDMKMNARCDENCN